MQMDWLDRLNIVAIGIISLIAIAMLTNNEISKSKLPVVQKVDIAAEKARFFALKLEKEAQVYKEVRSLMSQKDYDLAVSKLKEIIRTNPKMSRSYVHMAEISVIQDKKNMALHYYRKAIELEPGYVDKKSPVKIGMQIKPLVKEMRVVLRKKISQRPVSKETKTALKNVYYLQRRLAGGCE